MTGRLTSASEPENLRSKHVKCGPEKFPQPRGSDCVNRRETGQAIMLENTTLTKYFRARGFFSTRVRKMAPS